MSTKAYKLVYKPAFSRRLLLVNENSRLFSSKWLHLCFSRWPTMYM